MHAIELFTLGELTFDLWAFTLGLRGRPGPE